MIYTVTFNPAVDYVMRFDSLCAGQMNRTRSEEIFWGGKGINVSCVLKTLGIKSTALGFVAGFTGNALENAIKESGIDTDFVALPQGCTRICVKLFEKSNGRETELNANGPDIDSASIDKLLKKINMLKSGDYLILAGSVPKSVPQDIYETICQRLENSGVLIAADASGELLTRLLKYRPFLVKPNHYEAAEISGYTIDSKEKAGDCALLLKSKGALNAIVSMAGDGAVLAADDENVYNISAPIGTAVNSVGAGDSMLAGFIAGYIKSGSYETAIKWGVAAGSATAFSAGLAEKKEFDRLLREIN